jgi:prophage regulatory protein
MQHSIMPETGFVRITHICGDKKRGIPAVLPISRSTWWLGVASGKFPKGVLLGPRTRARRVEDIRALIDNPYAYEVR